MFWLQRANRQEPTVYSQQSRAESQEPTVYSQESTAKSLQPTVYSQQLVDDNDVFSCNNKNGTMILELTQMVKIPVKVCFQN